MDKPIEAYIDNQKMGEWGFYTDGKSLVAKVLPKNEWPERLREKQREPVISCTSSIVPSFWRWINNEPLTFLEEPIYLSLLRTPTSEYRDLVEHLHEVEGRIVNMGDIPTLLFYRQSEIEIKLDQGFLYDLFAFGTHKENRLMVGGGRLSTQRGETPYPVTLDGLKLIAIEHLELTLEQASQIQATITGLMRPGEQGMIISASFEFQQKGSGETYYVTVDHVGGVSPYYRKPRIEMSEALRV